MVANVKKFVKKHGIKRILGGFLALILVITMLPISNWQVHASDMVKVKVHLRNAEQWPEVYVYAWNPEELTNSWPGNKVSIDGDGYYTYEFNVSSDTNFNYIFNDGNGDQTGDLTISSSKLSADADGVVERWYDGAGNVYGTALSMSLGGTEVNGNQVNFSYYTARDVRNVYVTGTMNGWSTDSDRMQISNNYKEYTYSMTLEPGEYEYKFYREMDGKYYKDPYNPFMYKYDNNYNSILYIPGIITTSLTIEKDELIELPTELEYLKPNGGRVTKAVTYTSGTAGVTINGNSVTLADDFTADEFTVTATTADSESRLVNVSLYESDDVTVEIHYDRTDNKESEWNVWLWADNQGGQAIQFEEVNGEYVATYTVSEEDVPFINTLKYKIRKGEWEAEEAERQIDLSNVVAGKVCSYINADGTYSNATTQAVKGTKLKSVEYNRNNNTIVVDATGLVTDPNTDFVIKKADKTVINITDITTVGTTYYISIEEDLTSLIMSCGSYTLTYDDIEYSVKMPNLYKSEEFETEFTYTGSDLGAAWSETGTTFRVWAPTADKVQVQLYATGSDEEEGSAKLATHTMTRDVNGTWIATVEGDLNGVYYTYLTTVNGAVEESCDPYARTTGVNGERAMVLNLDSTDPKGWENDKSPNAGMSYTDAIIYELHVRDLSIDEESGVRDAWRGKFLGLTQKGTTNSDGVPTGLDHIRDLGVTHIHLLPSYDYASIDETLTEEEKAADTSKQYNWGYDPLNYNVPEGSYSTNPYDGAVRVSEMKEMVQTLHENNINVIMDVVYNHVYDAGNFCFNEIVPNYFSRTNADGSYSNGSGCGNDTASERAMVRKYIVDSVLYWADEYHIDGFRFDLVGLLDAETINEVVEEVHKTHPDVIFYGEGWVMNTAVEPSNTIMANQQNAGDTEDFAYFSDTFRDFLKGKNDETTWGYVQNTMDGDPEGTLMECFRAKTAWIPAPTQVVNYASCHDNYTLMDKINATKASSSFADRIKMNNLAAAIYMTAEGIPLIHAGEEILRTKVDNEGNIIHNSYNSPDYINSLKWGNLDSEEYQNTRDYYKGLIEFRKNHAALRLTTAADVDSYVTPIWIDENVVLFNIAGKASIPDEVSDGIVVIFNSNPTSKEVNLYNNMGIAEGTWNICINDVQAGTEVIDTVTDGRVTVPAISALVLVKGETVDTDSVYTRNTVAETGRVHIEYVDEDGNVLASDSITGAIGASYTTTAITIDGYTLKTTPANASGKHTSADIFVTYVYSADVVDNNPDAGTLTQAIVLLSIMFIGAMGIMLTGKKYFSTVK